MKRIWFAILFLLSAALLCTYEQLTVEKAYTEITTEITAAEGAESTQEELFYAHRAAAIWEEYYKKISLFTNHGSFEGIDLSFKMLKEYTAEDEEEINEQLIEAKSELEMMHEAAKISFSNIF